ncbi:MAG: hypothetical protein LAP61_05740 [Acidobacteriia bacterium]|nr:hypothetical protein [Terriglobia bacterium]
MDEVEIKNAVIESASLTTSERGLLTSYITLDYGGSGQGFGGYALYLPRSWLHHKPNLGYAGHFIFRVMEIAGVDEWKLLAGRTIRAKSSWSKVHAIGHIIKDDWFNPSIDFAEKKQP